MVTNSFFLSTPNPNLLLILELCSSLNPNGMTGSCTLYVTGISDTYSFNKKHDFTLYLYANVYVATFHYYLINLCHNYI